MRFPIPLVVELPDDQLAQWAERVGGPLGGGGPVRAKDAVEAVRGQVLEAVRDRFGALGVQADVTVKR